MPEEGRQDGLAEMRSEFASNQAEIEAKEEELRKLEKYVEGLRSMLTEFEEPKPERETSSFSDVLAQALGEMRALGALHQRLGGVPEPASEPVSRPPTELEARREALDRQLGPVPAELMSHVSDEPLTREERTPAWGVTPGQGEDREVPYAGVHIRLSPGEEMPKETPSQRAARIALSEKEEEDTAWPRQ
jgi:hypothetical protein